MEASNTPYEVTITHMPTKDLELVAIEFCLQIINGSYCALSPDEKIRVVEYVAERIRIQAQAEQAKQGEQ